VSRGRAVVYNNFMSEMGGGERSALAYAKALAELGFSSEIVCVNPAPDLAEIGSRFNEEFSDVVVRRIDGALLLGGLQNVQVFVNHTHLSLLKNPGVMGLYSLMFPSRRIPRDPEQVETLASYQRILCNSRFTYEHTLQRWACDPSRVLVLHPPLANRLIDLSERLEKDLPRKQKQLVAIGRFSTLQTKNQHLIIQSFLKALRSADGLKDWSLIVVGSASRLAAAESYFQYCQELAANSEGRVSVLRDVPFTKLSEILLASFGYIHAAGALARADQPELCEHFGLSIAEAMSHACIPVVHHLGGIFDILDKLDGALTYKTEPELVLAIQQLQQLYMSPDRHRSMQLRNLRAVRALRFSMFRDRLDSLIRSISKSTFALST